MNWGYGGFTADAKGSFARFSYTPVRINGRVTMLKWMASIDVYLMGADQDAVHQREQAFIRECSLDGRDFVYSFPDGTEHLQTVRTGSAVGGVRVEKAPSFEDPKPGEHSIFRCGSVVFSALLPLGAIPVGAIIQLDEDIQVDNRLATPREEVVELLRRPFVRVRPRAFGVAQATQSGTVIALGRYPGNLDIPAKRWPDNYVPGPGADVLRWARPIRIDGIPVAFGVDYSYRFMFSTPIPGSTLPRYI